jgi:hypothetical protein
VTGIPAQAELPLACCGCDVCEDFRESEPPCESMDPMPCPNCREREWWAWLADPWASLTDAPEYVPGNWYRTPARAGQLGLLPGSEVSCT